MARLVRLTMRAMRSFAPAPAPAAVTLRAARLAGHR